MFTTSAVLEGFEALAASFLDAYNHQGVPVAAAAALVVLGMVVMGGLWLGRMLPVLASLRVVAKRIGALDGTQGLAANFAEFDQALRGIPVLRHGWEEYKATLILPETGSAEPIRGTAHPGDYMGIAAAEAAGLPLRLQRVIPAYFVGTGLLLTLTGLAALLFSAGGAAPAAVRLDAVALQMLPSTAGLAVAMVLAVVDDALDHRLRLALDTISILLERRLPFITAQALAAAHFRQIRNHAMQADRTNREMVATVSRALEEGLHALPAGVGQAVTPLADSVADMAETIGAANHEVLGRLVHDFGEASRDVTRQVVEEFRKALHGVGGDEMNGLIATLDRIQRVLAPVAETLEGAVDELARRLDAAAERMQHWADAGDVLHRDMTEVASVWQTRLAESTETLHKTVAGAGAELVERLGATSREAAAALAPLADRAARFDAALAGVEERLGAQGETFDLIIARLGEATSAVSAVAVELRGKTQPIGEAAQQVIRAVERVEDAGRAIGGARGELDRIGAGLRGHAAIFTQEWEAHRDQLELVDRNLASVFARLVEGIAAYQNTIEDFVVEYGANARKASTAFDEQGVEMKKVIAELTEMMERRV